MACSIGSGANAGRRNGPEMPAENLAQLGEFGRIRQYLAPLAAKAPGALGLTDDAALIQPPPGEMLVVTADALVEGVHFLPDDPPDLIARKLLRCNLSDLAAMAATPSAYVMTMALPKRCDDRWVERFAAGLALDQAEFGVTLLGGDSVSNPGPIALSVTAFGHAPPDRITRRGGARPGDLVYVSGTIGDGALGLLAATGRLFELEPEERDFLADRYRLPRPRLALGTALGGVASAMMDISDGLVGDLDHLAAVSHVAATVEAVALPLSGAAASALALDPDHLETILTGGDDYELLFTAAPDADIAAIGAKLGIAVTPIGRIAAGAGVTIVDRDGAALTLVRRGYRHA
jgi:thiamine-monophosphate kinase